MNSKEVISIVIIIVIIVGGIFLFGNDSSTLPENSQAAVEESDEEVVEEALEEDSAMEEESDDSEVAEVDGSEARAEDEDQPVVITYTDEGFSPDMVEIENGQTIQWINNSSRNLWVASAVHPTHTQYPEKADSDCLGSSFDACIGIAPGENWEFTFSESGSWNYHDHLSSGRVGTIEVI